MSISARRAFVTDSIFKTTHFLCHSGSRVKRGYPEPRGIHRACFRIPGSSRLRPSGFGGRPGMTMKPTLRRPYCWRRGRRRLLSLLPKHEGSGAPKGASNFRAAPLRTRRASGETRTPPGAPPRRFSGPRAALFVDGSFSFGSFAPVPLLAVVALRNLRRPSRPPSASSSRAAVVPPGGAPRPPGALLARRCSRRRTSLHSHDAS